jgi:hypothetical protein
MKLGKRLQNDRPLAQKVRKLESVLRSIIGQEVPVEWDVVPHELAPYLELRLGSSGKGECTRGLPISSLENVAWLESVFRDMKATLDYLSNWLGEVEILFQKIRGWIVRSAPEFRIREARIKIDEAFSREYTTKELIIEDGEKSVEVRPIAAWSAGTEGRVDLIGSEQRHTLIFSRSEGGWLWVKEQKEVEFRPLTGDLFMTLVRDCME